jgi:alkylation response protein AidB-like acyl-CoA dehydrogenase
LREHADVDLRRAEARGLLGDHEVAGEREPERAREHVAVGGADHRFTQFPEGTEHAREAVGAPMLVDERLHRGELAEVAAGREHLLMRRSQHDAADGVVAACALQRGEQRVEQLARERVARVGLVERERGDAAGCVVADGHGTRQPNYAPPMAATDVLKPDHAARRRHFIFTEEHEALRESIRAFVVRELAPHAEEWEEATFPDSVFRRMGELGLLGLSMPERYGGQGGDYFCNLVLAEELSHSGSGGLAMGVTVHTDMATPPILQFGTEDQKQAYLVPALRGEKISCLGITEPDAGSDVSGIRTRAVRDGDEWVINGAKTYITNGQRAHFIVLVTRTDADAGPGPAGDPPSERSSRSDDARGRGFTLFLVDMDAPGVVREKRLEKLGMHASDTALLAFQDVRVPDTAVLGQVGKGFYHIMWELQGERLIGAASCVAGAQRAFDRTLAYALERRAFGRAIGHFQVIRHKFAAMATKIEASRQLVYTTAWRFANGEYPVREISMAKLHAAQMCCEVADECLQIHGGAGYMREYGIERAWRDLRLNRIGAGTDEIMLDVIGRSYGL